MLHEPWALVEVRVPVQSPVDVITGTAEFGRFRSGLRIHLGRQGLQPLIALQPGIPWSMRLDAGVRFEPLGVELPAMEAGTWQSLDLAFQASTKVPGSILVRVRGLDGQWLYESREVRSGVRLWHLGPEGFECLNAFKMEADPEGERIVDLEAGEYWIEVHPHGDADIRSSWVRAEAAVSVRAGEQAKVELQMHKGVQLGLRISAEKAAEWRNRSVGLLNEDRRAALGPARNEGGPNRDSIRNPLSGTFAADGQLLFREPTVPGNYKIVVWPSHSGGIPWEQEIELKGQGLQWVDLDVH
ncbi:MAG: hypothetical protein R3E96_06820 [Planctomycetota bacterium]